MIIAACYFAGEFHCSGKVQHFHGESSLVEIDSTNFDSHISGRVCFILFYTPHSALCSEMENKLNKLSAKVRGVYFYKFDVEGCETIVNRYNVSGVPNILIFRNGKEETNYSVDSNGITFSNSNVFSNYCEVIYYPTTQSLTGKSFELLYYTIGGNAIE